MNNGIAKFLKKDIGIALCLFLFFSVLALLVSNRTSGIEDVGEYLNNPVRVLYGEMPYRDFWLLMPPMEVFAPAALYRVFGLNMQALLAVNSLISALTGALAFMLGRAALTGKKRAMIFSLLIFFNSALLWYAGWNHSNWFMLSIISSAFFFMRYLKNEDGSALAYAGGFAALASSFRLYESAPFYIGCLIALWMHKKNAESFFKNCLLLLLPLVTLWVTLMALFFTPDGVLAAYKAIAIDAVSHGRAAYGGLLPDLHGDLLGMRRNTTPNGFLGLWRLSYYAGNFSRHILNYCSIFFALLIAAYLLKKKDGEKGATAWLCAWLLFNVLKIGEGLDSTVLCFAMPPAFLLILRHTKTDAFVAAVVFFSFYGAAGEYAARIVKNKYPIHAKGGTLFTDDRQFAEETEAVLKEINGISDPQGSIAILHRGPYPFFAATGRKNATAYDSLIDLLLRPSAEKEKTICDTIIWNRTRLAVVQPAIMAEGSGFETLKTCIKNEFDIGSVYANYLVYYPHGWQLR